VPTTVRFLDRDGAVAGTVILGDELAPFVETLRHTAIGYGFVMEAADAWDPLTTATLRSEDDANCYLRKLVDGSTDTIRPVAPEGESTS